MRLGEKHGLSGMDGTLECWEGKSWKLLQVLVLPDQESGGMLGIGKHSLSTTVHLQGFPLHL